MRRRETARRDPRVREGEGAASGCGGKFEADCGVFEAAAMVAKAAARSEGVVVMTGSREGFAGAGGVACSAGDSFPRVEELRV
jgi:hypothetical protein